MAIFGVSKETVADLEGQIRELTRQVTILRTENQKQKTEIEKLNGETTRLHGLYKKYHDENQTLRTELAAREKTIEGLRNAIGKWKQRAHNRRKGSTERKIIEVLHRLEYNRRTGRVEWRQYETWRITEIPFGIEDIDDVHKRIKKLHTEGELVEVKIRDTTCDYKIATWL
jgi:chromosome segregation ATPase